MNRRRKIRRQYALAAAVGESRREWLRVLRTDEWRDEIIVDNFAGGGGASTGIELATGGSVTVAINHDPAAVAMHEVNHPNTLHYLEDVWAVDPRDVMPGRRIGLAWFSPDCTHHIELYAAQGFPRNYIINGYNVNGKSVTKADQVARCGNSVPPQFAESLVRANLPEHCTGSGKRLVFERYRETTGQLQLSM